MTNSKISIQTIKKTRICKFLRKCFLQVWQNSGNCIKQYFLAKTWTHRCMNNKHWLTGMIFNVFKICKYKKCTFVTLFLPFTSSEVENNLCLGHYINRKMCSFCLYCCHVISIQYCELLPVWSRSMGWPHITFKDKPFCESSKAQWKIHNYWCAIGLSLRLSCIMFVLMFL